MSRERIARICLWPLVTMLRALPSGGADRLGAALGWLWYRVVPIRRSVARENVGRALSVDDPGREAIVRAMYLHLGRSFVELLRFGGRSLAPEMLQVEGRDHLEAAIGNGRGALILTAHLGNWELLVRSATLADRPGLVVTKTFRAGWAEAVWRALRRGGPELVTAGGSARRIVHALRDGALVGYVLDQHDPGRRAVRLPFFGRDAATSPDLVRLARLSGAAIVPVFTWREGRGHVIRIEPPVELADLNDEPDWVEQGTARCLARVEAAIAAQPEQWLWIHRRWKPGRSPSQSGS